MEDFKKGQKIQIHLGGYAKVLEKLGEGGQGIVYKVEYKGKQYALKWYFYDKLVNPNAFIKNLEDNIKDRATSEKFLWPLFLTEKQFGSFGYLMNLRPKEYAKFPDILNAKVKFNNIQAIVNTALNITNGFRQLHRSGKSYQDLNDGGFFINTQNGDVLICDCDNVAPYGKNLGIAGKPGYMAPEIVCGKDTPSMQTDKYSLAIVLFKLLLRGDPLEGAKVLKSVCLTEAAEKKHYGTEPIFIFDPDNDTNRPVRGVHNNPIKFWKIFPQYIKDAFIQSFTVGLMHPEERIIENTWQKLFIRLRGEIINCSYKDANNTEYGCGNQTFLSNFINLGNGQIQCPKCGLKYSMPLKLIFKDYDVYLVPQTKLYECHTNSDSDNYENVTAEVVQNKSNPGIWGIKNLSNTIWNIKTPDGKLKAIPPNSVVPIFKDVEIDFSENNIVKIV